MAKVVNYSYEQVHQILAKLAQNIQAKGETFDAMIAIGSGGYIPSRILKNYIDCPVLSVTVTHYSDLLRKIVAPQPRILQWIDVEQTGLKGKKILLVDEVDDTRSTLVFCTKRLLDDGIGHISVAVLHNKLKPKCGDLPPKVAYYAGEEIDDHWIVYPWEAKDI